LRLFRLFHLMDHLRARVTPVTARDLAELTGMSVRSIYRDIADLQAMGAPIRGEGGMGYVMERGYFMPSLHLEADELEAVALGMRLVVERSGERLSKAALRVSAKISSTLEGPAREELFSAPLEAGPSTVASAVKASPLHDDLREAIRTRRMLRIEYVDLAGRRSSRQARPLGLTVFDEAWLLTIWCERSQDFRHLRIDRIESATDLGRAFRHEVGKRFSDSLVLERAKWRERQAT
jgi:predicted DNA-binding transcriptional regulator YafY